MSLFKRRPSQEERLRELDRQNQEARDGLNREYVRGHLIRWIKNFEQLDRFFLRQYSSEEQKRFILAQVAMDCTKFCQAHKKAESSAVAVVLLKIAQDLESHIRLLARNQGLNSNYSLEEIILELTEGGQMKDVVIYLKELKCGFERA